MTTTYDWVNDTTTISSVNSVDLLYPATADFVVACTLVQTPDTGSAGIKVTDGANTIYYSVGPLTGANVITPDPNMTSLALEWKANDRLIVPYCSQDGVTWVKCSMPLDDEGVETPYPTMTTPTQAGFFLDTGPTTLEEVVVFGAPRVLPGSLMVPTDDAFSISSVEEMLKAIGTVPAILPDPVTASAEAIVHALVGAPFGDLEFDVGKSVGWLARFVDDLFVTDVNLGDQRYWVVNWTKSFAHTYYKFSGINFFMTPVDYRKGQVNDAFAYAAANPTILEYDDNDWVIFLDAHEGLSTDTRSKPDDYLVAPYKSFMYREIARANAAGRDRVVIPFFVFLRHDHIQNASQTYTDLDDRTFTVTQSVGVPYYQPKQGLTRMFKVSALKNPAFDWSILDQPVAVIDPAVKIQLVSYAYAHWNLQDIPPGETRVPPLDATNDDGWKQRCSISKVLPVTGLPAGNILDPVGTWIPPSSDVAGVRGPWCFDTYADKVTGALIPDPPPPIDPSVAGIMTPMYDLVFRINVRDGVWYGAGGTGNTQLIWNEDLQEFIAYGQPVPVP